jgi:hypothetical protein
MLPQVAFAYTATCALEIEHTPFEASFVFPHEEPLDLMFHVRPSIPVSQHESRRLRLLQEAHAMVHLVLKLHTDEMQDRSNLRQPRTSFEET